VAHTAAACRTCTVLLMTAFNFFSHGTQDLYPTFLEVQQKFSTTTVGTIAVVYNVGAILGGITFGLLSERIGRRRAIVLASLLAIPVNSALGVLIRSAAAGAPRLPHAVRRLGRMRHHPRAPQ